MVVLWLFFILFQSTLQIYKDDTNYYVKNLEDVPVEVTVNTREKLLLDFPLILLPGESLLFFSSQNNSPEVTFYSSPKSSVEILRIPIENTIGIDLWEIDLPSVSVLVFNHLKSGRLQGYSKDLRKISWNYIVKSGHLSINEENSGDKVDMILGSGRQEYVFSDFTHASFISLSHQDQLVHFHVSGRYLITAMPSYLVTVHKQDLEKIVGKEIIFH